MEPGVWVGIRRRPSHERRADNEEVDEWAMVTSDEPDEYGGRTAPFPEQAPGGGGVGASTSSGAYPEGGDPKAIV